MEKIRVLIADGYDVYRHGLRTILAERANIIIRGVYKSGTDLVASFAKDPDSVCIISSNISDANIHILVEQLKKHNQDVKIIVCTYSTDINHLNQSLKAGVSGYLTKDVSSAELIDAVEGVAAGNRVLGKSVSQMMVNKIADSSRTSSSRQKNKKITKREKEVLKLIVEGFTSSEIAKKLFISTRTVETHRSNLMNKLELKNTAALVRYAIEEPDIVL